MPEPFEYRISAADASGQPVDVTVEPVEPVEPVEGAVYYAEYWTGPSPWWRRAWRRLRRPR